jgi:hypothetical protein
MEKDDDLETDDFADYISSHNSEKMKDIIDTVVMKQLVIGATAALLKTADNPEEAVNELIDNVKDNVKKVVNLQLPDFDSVKEQLSNIGVEKTDEEYQAIAKKITEQANGDFHEAFNEYFFMFGKALRKQTLG